MSAKTPFGAEKAGISSGFWRPNFFHALHGFTGGVLIPLAFTIVMIMLPRSK